MESVGKRRLQISGSSQSLLAQARPEDKTVIKYINPHVSEWVPLLRIQSIPEKKELTQTPSIHTNMFESLYSR